MQKHILQKHIHACLWGGGCERKSKEGKRDKGMKEACSRIQILNIVNMPILSKLIYRLDKILIKISVGFLVTS